MKLPTMCAAVAELAALSVGAALLVAPATAQLPDDWERRDLEARWVAYRAAVDADTTGKMASQWAWALVEKRDAALLECIAIYEGWHIAGDALLRLDAPQWVRCAVWNLEAFDSHARDGAQKALLADDMRALAWFERYPAAAARPGAAKVLELLHQRGIEARGIDKDLPPLDPMQVLVPWLDVPGELADFGERLSAEPRVRYRHQVVRALGAVIVHGLDDGRILTKVVRLTGHDDAFVQKHAFDTLARLPPAKIPHDVLIQILDDPGQPAARRRSAAVVLALALHPDAMQRLVAIVQDPTHAAYDVARSRLAELGDPVGLESLRGVDARSIAHLEQVQELLATVDERATTPKLATPPTLQRMLLRVAWLHATQHRDAERVAQQTFDLLTSGPFNIDGVIVPLRRAPDRVSVFDEAIRDDVDRELQRYLERFGR